MQRCCFTCILARQYGLWQFFDILCCLAVLVPVSWSIKALGSSDSGSAHDKGAPAHAATRAQARTRTRELASTNTVPRACACVRAASLPRLQQFRNFYVTLVVFVYCTRIISLIIKGTLHYSSVRARTYPPRDDGEGAAHGQV